MEFPALGRIVNTDLLASPISWAMVWVIASIWMLAFHVAMRGWQSMSGGPQAAFAAPGQVAAPVAAASDFSVPAAGAASSIANVQIWADRQESKYPEDGWTAAF